MCDKFLNLRYFLLKKMEFTIVDIETTGLSAHRHKIIEIGAAKVRNRKIVDEFESLINPNVRIPRFITGLTGIDNEMVEDAPEIDEVLPKFNRFLSNDVFVAHNASFDYKFLDFAFQDTLFKIMKNHKLCTRKLANRLIPELPSKKLGYICEHFEIVNEQAHRALGDVRATACVLNNFLDILEKRNIKDIDSVLKFQDMPCWKARKLICE